MWVFKKKKRKKKGYSLVSLWSVNVDLPKCYSDYNLKKHYQLKLIINIVTVHQSCVINHQLVLIIIYLIFI